MTIARSQMNRQLYGIPTLQGREQYGLGSVLKKFAKTFIPKELDPVLQVAAPFLGPVYGPIAAVAGSARTGKINPITLAAATLPYVQFGGEGATGLGSFMPVGYGGSGAIELPGGALQLGEKGTSLASALGKYFDIGATPYSEQGQGTVSKIFSTLNPASTLTGPERIANILDLGKSATDAIFYKTDPVTGKQVLDKQAAFAAVMAIPSYIDAKKKADELGLSPNEFNEQIYNEQKAMYQMAYQSRLPMSSFMRTTAQMGGIMGAQQEQPIFPRLETLTQNLGQAEQTLGQPSNQFNKSSITTAITGQQPQGFAEGGLLSIQLTPRSNYFLGDLVSGSGVAVPVSGSNQNISISSGGLGGMISKLIQQNPQLFKQQTSSSSTIDFVDVNPRDGIDDRLQKAMGGKIPVRQNQSGVSELDLRAKGGYIPVGIKEKADDVPAMLSKNEFVFTADAVRGAGNGSINKGAQKMYKLMKSLEKKVKKSKVA